MGAQIRHVSIGTITDAIATLYQAHPSISAFTVSSMQYTPATRDKVLGVCRNGGQAADQQTLESNRVLACGPLIYYFYSYGTQQAVPQSVAIADDLFSYVATSIHGPFDAATTLGALLRSWGVPLAPSATGEQSTGPRSATPQGTLLAAAKAAVAAQSSVHLRLTETAASGHRELTIEGVFGTSTATETIRGTGTRAELRLTRSDAYLSGSPSGLTSVYGISPADAAKVGTRWVDISRGTREYTDLAHEDTLSAVTAATLPASTATTSIATRTSGGTLVYQLTWTAPRTTGSGTIHYTLELAATGSPLPLTETSRTGGVTQTTTFSHWDEPIDVHPPTAIVPFRDLGK